MKFDEWYEKSGWSDYHPDFREVAKEAWEASEKEHALYCDFGAIDKSDNECGKRLTKEDHCWCAECEDA